MILNSLSYLRALLGLRGELSSYFRLNFKVTRYCFMALESAAQKNRKIRVLHFAGIINRYDIIDSVLTRLDRSRFEVHALTGVPPRQTGRYTAEEEYPTRCLNFEFNRRRYPRMYRALMEEIQRVRPHVLQVHHFDENVVAAWAVRRTRVPCYIIGRHYSDHIYYLTRGLKRQAFLAAEGFSNRTANRIAVPARDIARLLTERQGVPREKIEVIPFGLDFKKYQASAPEAPARLRREFGLEGSFMALACCRLNPEKGLEYLLQAVPEVRARVKNFKLVFVGNGPREGELRRLASELGAGDVVQFVGWRDDALDWVAAADAVVQPSFCESFCQVLMEALAFAKPMVMTPVGAAPDVIGNDERGLLVPPGDAQAIAAALVRLAENRHLGAELGARGQTFIRENMAAEVTTRRYEHLYETALEEASARAGR
jgi:glycosyltransferase involved in cell wall biosynthesis